MRVSTSWDVRAMVPELLGTVKVRVVLALMPESWKARFLLESALS
jgi:hypothetical protein